MFSPENRSTFRSAAIFSIAATNIACRFCTDSRPAMALPRGRWGPAIRVSGCPIGSNCPDHIDIIDIQGYAGWSLLTRFSVTCLESDGRAILFALAP